LSPDAPFGLGLRLSAREGRELLEEGRLEEFRAYLDREGLYVALINGFPYGPFHGVPVKAQVYAPDWRDEARVHYTLDLVEILRGLLPDGMDGGISTVPLSYKPWIDPAERPRAFESIVGNLLRVAERLAELREEDGCSIHLDIEPEPDCLIENTAEAIAFFEDWLLARGGDEVREHIQLCADCCHAAVEYETTTEALDRISSAGIGVGRIQLSSAIDVEIPGDATAAAEVVNRLRRFADSTYLHQVRERRGPKLERFSDLNDALESLASAPGARHWRIHFHVPLFTADYEGLGSTQDYVRDVMARASAAHLTRHFEIETYTWDVLPAGLKIDLLESIAREYEWVLGEFKKC
jgi:sugar phosphate isomerase/epimerase